MHIIIIADESGSMNDEWASVSQTVHNFISHFATTDDESHLFSVILFNNTCRYHAKREKASNVQKLPHLSGGGTNYEPAFEMGSKFVDITPSDYAPVIIFMTDGNPQDGTQMSLKQLTNLSKIPDFMFFAIKYGSQCNQEIFTDLSKAGNNNKQICTFGPKQIKFIYDAQDYQELQQVFDVFKENFDFAAQENAVDCLKKQLKREEVEFENQSEFYKKMNDRKILNNQKEFEQNLKFKEISIEEREKSYNNYFKN